MSELSREEMDIIDHAINNADVWGAGRLTYAKEAIVDEGYKWTDDHEQYLGNVKTSSELKFATTEEAMQHLSDFTGKKVIVAAENKTDVDVYSYCSDQMGNAISHLSAAKGVVNSLSNVWRDFDEAHPKFEAERNKVYDAIDDAMTAALDFEEENEDRATSGPEKQDGY